jgi:hypothetical protein
MYTRHLPFGRKKRKINEDVSGQVRLLVNTRLFYFLKKGDGTVKKKKRKGFS